MKYCHYKIEEATIMNLVKQWTWMSHDQVLFLLGISLYASAIELEKSFSLCLKVGEVMTLPGQTNDTKVAAM